MLLPRKTTAVISLSACLLLPQLGWAHGGGLNSDGCHNVTATGGYHCHRDQKQEDNLKAAGAVLGGLAILWLLMKWISPTDAPTTGFTVTPTINPEGSGFAAEYGLDGVNRIGISTQTHESKGSDMRIHWRLVF